MKYNNIPRWCITGVLDRAAVKANKARDIPNILLRDARSTKLDGHTMCGGQPGGLAYNGSSFSSSHSSNDLVKITLTAPQFIGRAFA